MRQLFLAMALVGVAGLAVAADDKKADDKKPAKIIKKGDASKKEKPAIKLRVGDPAPPLKATKWLQGDEVKKFERDKVYVVEFWATWCGPCIVMMPHMAEMQAEYRNKGVTFIGYSTKDPNNTEEKVVAFLKKRGPNLGYTFAYADDRNTYDAWMRAAGRGGIPCSFVVDKASRIAYIGHPMYLDVVLPKVVSGSWDSKVSADEVGKIEEETSEVFKALRGDPAESLKALTAFEAKHQELNQIPYFMGPKLSALLKTGKTAEARKFAEAVVKKAGKYADAMALRTVSATLRTEAKGNKDLMGLAVKAAEGMLAAEGDKNAMALVNLASTHFAAGNKEKAREYGKRAVEAAEDEPARVKQSIEKQVKQFEE
ncbi:MAG: redoxin family protein [Gemmataceae bacterium]